MVSKLILDASSYKQGIDIAKQATATINKELDLWKIQNKATNDSLKTLSQQAKANADTQKILSAEIDLTKQKLKEVTEVKGAASKEAMSYQNKLLDLEIQQAKLNKEIGGGLTPLQNFKNSMKETGEQLQKMGDKMQSVGKTMSTYLTAPIVVAGVGILKLASSASEYADEIGVMAEKTGMSVKSLQEMRYVTNQLDMEFSTIENTMSAFTNKLKGADSDTGAFSESLRKLHVRVKENGQYKDLSDLYTEIIEKLSGMTNESERNVRAAALFGKSWDELAPMLNAGGEEIEKLRKRANELNLVISDEGIESAREYGDAMDEIKMQFQQMGMELGISLIPVLKDSFIPALQSIISTFKPILELIGKINPQTLIFIAAFAGIIAVVGPLIFMVGSLTTAVGGIAAAFGAMNLTGIQTALIVGGIILALTALAAIIAVIIGRSGEVRSTAASIANSIKGISGNSSYNVPSYDVGTPYVPQDTLAMVHKGERIIPASQNRSGLGGGVNVIFNGPVYGVLDFEQRVKQIVRDAGSEGAFRGVFQNG
jgi:uncharacterized coiled-coil protein SlyX